jgi:hypothetical protein
MARLLCAALPAVFLFSCAWFGPRTDLRIRIPAPPHHWERAFSDLRYSVLFQDSAGSWQTVTVAGQDRTTVVSCWKAGNAPVLAYPCGGRCGSCLRPAGGLYPLDCVDGNDPPELLLSWEGGFVASVFTLLAQRGFDTSLINAPRLSSYVARHPDPWDLDIEGIAEKLARGTFSAYDVDLLPTRDVILIPGAGEWFLESPFAATRPAAASESITLAGLGVGMHALFSVQGGGIRIWVGEKETVIGPLPGAEAGGNPAGWPAE